ncbi:sphingosine-1-phosphate phosphatase 2-like [Penaeus japonicus]|uniref:sphingosine-1-phosphate phosphatase 2-like n=1 Tax=Penaeus japonicus TaxID=27405 RepID=UPI001C716120|nr:sphingosine-1-phosphate phosphatase 2-like [Penaeus japonicus]XP_042878619.1 sphingosine-1-phosphate phosphatase 2-like [Penaeus japonicus]XP_042878620.1 sphingosine-1-phosphate phosphatase 2-like [Penaeus japonicus]XP_042878621.1 sphingosine-1-phosphate phosphatase 2-like [Penaeus japonicus]
MPCSAGDTHRLKSSFVTAGTMNLVDRLQDPQLVADFQRLFGVRRKSCKRGVARDASEGQEGSGTSRENLLDRYLGDQRHQNESMTQRRCQQLPVPDVHHKTHIRQGSTASVASDCSTGSGRSWMEKLLGENTGGTEGSMGEEEEEGGGSDYEIDNRFWYHMFSLATAIGGEIFYSIFFCFWAWNVDGAVLRRVIVIWMITMYIGQALKDILKVPRPACPPVVRLDPKWALEYGLPSTHAMVGAAMPFSILILTLNRYQLDWGWGLAIATTWCLLVCLSRLYLGMHSVLDVLCGLVLVTGLLVLILPWVDVLDHLALTHPASPLLTITLTIAMVVCYPATDRWTPARGDTTVIVGVGCGSLLGSWLNYQLGITREPTLPPPYTVIWPTLNMAGLSLLRTILGLVVIVAVKAIFKALSFATICALLQVKAEDYVNKTGSLTSRHRLIVELFYKFITYIAIGFTIAYTGPLAFRLIGIERPTFYTEV